MKRILRYALWAIVAAVCVAACLLGDLNRALQLVALPFAPIAAGLRSLSLSGAAGNAAAIVLYILLSLLPLLGLLPLRRARHWEDWLLVLAVPVQLAVYWCMINPGRLNAISIPMEQISLGAAVWMLLLCWALLRLLRACFDGNSYRAIYWLLEGLGLAFFVAIFGSAFGNYLSTRADFLAGNTGGHALTETFLLLQCLVLALPYACDLWVLASARTLLTEAAADRYSGATVTAAGTLARRCRTALTISLLVTTGFNLLQLLFLPQLRGAFLRLTLPLSSLIFVLLVLVLSRQYAEGKQLKDDNDAFI